jgi:hypothetical protein
MIKQYFLFLLFIFLPILIYSQMKDSIKVRFEPKEFQDIILGLEYCETECRPKHPYPIKNLGWEGILINVPDKIIISSEIDSLLLTIPLCSFEVYTGEKSNKVNFLKIYIENTKEKKEYASIIDFRAEREKHRDPYTVRNPADRPETEEELEKSKHSIASKMVNINVLKYVEMPIKAGKYKIYAECAGFKSNIKEFEIIIGE